MPKRKRKNKMETEPTIDYGDEDWQDIKTMDDDWDTYIIKESEPVTKQESDYLPPEYLLQNNIAKHKQLAQIMAVYFHAKHGEPMQDVFEHLQDTRFEETPVHFHLGKN